MANITSFIMEITIEQQPEGFHKAEYQQHLHHFIYSPTKKLHC